MIENDISSFLFQAGGSPLGGVGMLLPLLFIFGIFYVLLILPQQRRQKRWQAMINDLKTGDRVTTQGGIRGSIITIKDDAVHLRVPPDNLRLEVAKSAVTSVARDEEPRKSEK
jgi:preprotein translocase subunit YajC